MRSSTTSKYELLLLGVCSFDALQEFDLIDFSALRLMKLLGLFTSGDNDLNHCGERSVALVIFVKDLIYALEQARRRFVKILCDWCRSCG